MYSSLSQTQTQSQVQTLAPQLRQSLKILQAPLLELRHVLMEELQTNPVLEELASALLSTESEYEGDENFDEPFWLREQSGGRTEHSSNLSSEEKNERQHFLDSIIQPNSYEEKILEEARLAGLDANVCKAIEYILGSLDERGYLTLSMEDLAIMSGIEEKDFSDGIHFLKTIEPYGLGAPDLRTCLLWQIEALYPEEALVKAILTDHYDLLLRNRFSELAKLLKVSTEVIQDAIAVIGTLNPHPGSCLAQETTCTVTADVTIEKIGNTWVITLPNDYLPKIRINPRYEAMIQEGKLSSEDQGYIKDKMREGAVLIHALSQRQNTLMRIAEILLDTQEDFFEKGVAHLKPMTMQQMATQIGVHETTVSRAVSHKYLQCPTGLFELKYFFSGGYESSSGPVSFKSIQDKIVKLISHEDPHHPLSDQTIVSLLIKEDPSLTIARRTVAKYREQMKILPTHLRRR